MHSSNFSLDTEKILKGFSKSWWVEIVLVTEHLYYICNCFSVVLKQTTLFLGTDMVKVIISVNFEV